jgi:hypothetical protein
MLTVTNSENMNNLNKFLEWLDKKNIPYKIKKAKKRKEYNFTTLNYEGQVIQIIHQSNFRD